VRSLWRSRSVALDQSVQRRLAAPHGLRLFERSENWFAIDRVAPRKGKQKVSVRRAAVKYLRLLFVPKQYVGGRDDPISFALIGFSS
jgi:hypothetical protein